MVRVKGKNAKASESESVIFSFEDGIHCLRHSCVSSPQQSLKKKPSRRVFNDTFDL